MLHDVAKTINKNKIANSVFKESQALTLCLGVR